MYYIFIDPGSSKFGWAVYCDNRLLEHGVYLKEEFNTFILKKSDEFFNLKVVIGDGTTHKFYISILNQYFPSIDCELIDEKYSTEEARKKYFQFNPPKWWKRFIPVSLLVPEKEYDDYTAIVLAERYFKSSE
jgi:hypothetical protein